MVRYAGAESRRAILDITESKGQSLARSLRLYVDGDFSLWKTLRPPFTLRMPWRDVFASNARGTGAPWGGVVGLEDGRAGDHRHDAIEPFRT